MLAETWNALECMIAWTPPDMDDYDEEFRSMGPGTHPTAGEVKIGPFPDSNGWSNAYLYTDGACWCHWHECSTEGLKLRLLIVFNKLVVRDGIDPTVAHKNFMSIDEYRECIANDLPGMPEGPSLHEATPETVKGDAMSPLIGNID